MFDILGILVLAVLAGVGGFLAVRAWKSRNAFLKWGGVVAAGLLTLAATALFDLGRHRLLQTEPAL